MKKLILLLILIFSLPVAAQNFTIGKSTFLLNGKPFTVKAAELHYTRIPVGLPGAPLPMDGELRTY